MNKNIQVFLKTLIIYIQKLELIKTLGLQILQYRP